MTSSMSPSPAGARSRLAFVLFALAVLPSLARAASTEDAVENEKPSTALALTARCVAGGNAYVYFRFARTEMRIEEGDVLEYDVYVDGSSPLPRGGVDVLFAGGFTLRDSGATDTDGLTAHGDADLSPAIDRWVRRKIPLDALAGRVATRFLIGCEGDVPGTYVHYVDDVVITNPSGERRVVIDDEHVDTIEIASAKSYDTVYSGLVVAPRREKYDRGRIPFLHGGVEGSPERFRVLDLGPHRDRRGIGADADFDGSGQAFPSGELPTEPTVLSGIPFDLPPADAAADHVSAHGQVIDFRALAPGTAFVACLLAASRSSTLETPLFFVEESGAASAVPLLVPAWTETATGGPVFEFSHRTSGASGRILGPTRLSILTVPVALESAAVSLRLPETPDFRIFAITFRPLASSEIDDDFRIGWLAHTVRTPETADYLRNYRFARLTPDLQAEEGRLRRLYDLAVAGDELAFRTTVLERLSRFSEIGARHKTLTTHVAAWLDLSRPPRTAAADATERVADLVRALQGNEDLVATISGVAALDAVATANPTLLAELKRLALSRRVEFAAFWALPRPARTGGATLVRNLLLGQRFLTEKFGSPSRVAALLADADLPPTLPQVLRKAGVDHAVFLPGSGESAVSEEARSGAVLRWEGTDGSRLVGIGPAGHPEGAITGETLLGAAVGLERRQAVKDVLVLFGAASDMEQNLGAVRDAAASRLLPRVKFDRVESYGDALAALRDVELPVVKGLPFEARAEAGGGEGARPGPGSSAVSRARFSEAALVAAESLRATLPEDDPSDLAEEWRRFLVTVAGDPKESDLAPAEASARAALAAAAAKFAASANVSGESPDASTVVVVNPLGFEREEAVEIALPSGDEPHRVLGPDGAETAIQPLAGGERALVSLVVPPFGRSVLRILPGGAGTGETPPAVHEHAAVAESHRLENRFVRVTIDPASGRIASLFDKTSGRETLGGDAGGPAAALFVAGPGAESPRLSSASVVESGPVRAVIALEFATDSGLLLRKTIGIEAGSPRVQVDVDWTGRPRGESAAMKLPVAGPGPFTTVVETPFGAAARPFPLPGSMWIDVSNETGAGIAIFAGRGSTIGIADTGAIAVGVDERGSFCLVPHGAPPGFGAARPERNAAALLVPMIAVPASAREGTGAGAESPLPFLKTSGSDGALVEGLRRAADGTGIVVRIREARGTPADALLQFAFPVQEALEADLIERTSGRSFPTRGGEVAVGLAPFEIQTVIVRPAKQDTKE